MGQVPFDHPDWIFELKYDGWRALVYSEAGTCRLVSRNGNAFKRFADLCTATAAVIPGPAVLDGEVVCLDAEGKPQFFELMRRRMAATYCAFDVLSLDGRDLRGLPLLERKQALRRLIQPPLMYVDHVDARGVDLFRLACERDLEGIVGKRADGNYNPDDTTWVRIKNPNYSQAQGRGELLNPPRTRLR